MYSQVYIVKNNNNIYSFDTLVQLYSLNTLNETNDLNALNTLNRNEHKTV